MKFFRKIGTVLLAGAMLLTCVDLPQSAYARTMTTANVKGILDSPVVGSSLAGTQNVKGWFLDQSGVAKIEVMVDGNVVGKAYYGDSRPDVQRAYPLFNNGKSGFHFTLNTTKFSDGKHTVSIKETAKNGRVTTLPATPISIANTKGVLDTPVTNSTLTGTQNVKGWFLDGNGVKKLEILVDGKVTGQAVYGDARPDVKTVFPLFKNGNSGFHFALDTTKFSDGDHTIAVRETSKNGRVTTLPENKVKFENTKGELDHPAAGSILTGSHEIKGWILDQNGVSKIEVLVDGKVVGQAVYGDTRLDVKKAFLQFKNGKSGFHYTLDTTKFSDGLHTITIREKAMNGNVKTLPSRSVTIKNVEGVLDTPTAGSTLTGTKNVSGWFLNAHGIAKIEVLVDGTVVGQAAYGDARSDVEKAFPQFRNGHSGFHYFLDTTKFTDGNHTVTIKATGKDGLITTLPNRSITIKNIIGTMDSPTPNSTLQKIINISGWLLDQNGVKNIEVLIDGAVVGQAVYGDVRKDVQKAYPDFKNGNSGYHFSLDTTKYSEGKHTITIKATNNKGQVTTLPSTTVAFNQSAFTVFLDPGHGGYDPGATAGGYQEKNLNLAVAKKVQSILLNKGYTVYMSRSNDTFIPLLDRSSMANNAKADIFVSIHTNSTGTGATSASGIESFYYEYDPDYPSKINDDMDDNPQRVSKSITLTNIIQKKMASYTGAYNRGTAGNSFSVIRESAMPATLVEIGFINNDSERNKLITDYYQSTLARSIADGIVEYFKTF
ncbi:N-acetylmuramoyl-L-alanine amidase [Neobacillus sp. LXY-1]|uniref:N-acetylmuramoyl-L-alanine amidase n=1 Tax=Neobacillus sp. LXY-1 TaxID=3379133 RepID=UPI003EE40A44